MNILLAVSGSIASYKSIDVARLLVKSGHSVKVVLTNGALEFVKPETFRYLGVEDVFLPTDDFKPTFLKAPATVLHIELAKWADKLVVAPLSANTLSRLALGLNNDLLGSLFLALGSKPVLLFPAMNTQMWNDVRIQGHVKKLQQDKKMGLVNPVSGLLACGDVGAGKFPDVNAVADFVENFNPLLDKKKKVVITAGATASPLDPVRFLTNPSSGKMGLSVARAFLREGYAVTLLAGHQCTEEVNQLVGHPLYQVVQTPTTAAMKDAALKHFQEASLYISTGAIADIEFEVADAKIKKESMGQSLPFRLAADILGEILKVKKADQKVVSFAAETETSEKVFMEKMKRKPVDLMIGNKVGNGLIGRSEIEGFRKAEGEYFAVTTKDIKGPFALKKQQVGERLVSWFEGQPSWS